MLTLLSMEQVHRAAQDAGGKIFENAKGFDLNLIGVRSADSESDGFNDMISVSYYFDKAWHYFAYAATTDPGLFYRKRENWANSKGTGVLPEGFHRGLWQQGTHRGRYDALVQSRPVTLWRDTDGDASVNSGDEDTGYHGVNLHRANASRPSTIVGKWSAACQVIQDPAAYDMLMALCKRQAETLGYLTYSYTLLHESKI